MNDVKEIRYNLINEIMHIEDIDMLHSIFRIIAKRRKQPVSGKLEEVVVEVKKGWTLDEIVAKKNIVPITYPEIVKIVDEIEWDVPLTDLLSSTD
ncbi:MAG: hypothetical protein AAGI38_03135 [Bacteroidota bacterium]